MPSTATTTTTRHAQVDDMADQALRSSESSIRSGQRAAHETLDNLSGKLHDVRDHAGQTFDRLSTSAEALARRSMDAVRDRSAHLRERAVHASDTTVGYIRDEPVKSILIAAAAGAALMALVSLLSRSRDY